MTYSLTLSSGWMLSTDSLRHRHQTDALYYSLSRVRSKLKVLNSSTLHWDFQGPKLHFSSTKIIDKKPYPRLGHSQFGQQCDTEVYCIVLASKLSTNAKFQNLQHLNSRTFQGFSSTFKHLICFQALSRALKFLNSKFKHFQRSLKHAMNPDCRRDQRNNSVEIQT